MLRGKENSWEDIMKRSVLLAFALLSSVVSTYAQFTFTSIDYPGGTLTTARGINNQGEIVGSYRIVPPRHALLIRKGKFIPLAKKSVLATNYSEAFKINDHGDVVGNYQGNDGFTHGFLLHEGVVNTLDFSGASDTYAFGINNVGTVVGYWDILDPSGNVVENHGFIWENGSFQQKDFPGSVDSVILGINNRGELVGEWDAGITSPIGHGFVCSKGNCSSYDVPLTGATLTQVDDINADGQMVGAYIDGTGGVHGFLASGTSFTSLDFPGAMNTLAWGINSAGQIVGNFHNVDGSLHGFLAQPTSVGKPEYAYSANLNQITGFNVDLGTGALSAPSNVAGPNDAGGMVADPSAKFLYVSDFTGSAIDGFAINPSTGGLSQINGSPFQVGNENGPAGMAIDPAGKFLFLAHANLNSIFAFTRDPNTGAITSVPGSPFAAATSPFHVAVHPSGNFLYASNYNDSMGSISAYTIDPATGVLAQIAGSPFATQAGYPGPGRLAIDPRGKFLYVGLDGTVNANHFVAAFSIDSSTGALTAIAGSPFTTGSGPLSVAVDRSGGYLYTANSFDNTISGFAIDPATGVLTSVSGSPFATGALGGFPFALAVDPSGMFLYTGNQASNNVSGLSLNATTGALTTIPGSPFAGVTNPYDLIVVKIP
jgi:6-phosphogluconolactonase